MAQLEKAASNSDAGKSPGWSTAVKQAREQPHASRGQLDPARACGERHRRESSDRLAAQCFGYCDGLPGAPYVEPNQTALAVAERSEAFRRLPAVRPPRNA